MSHGRQPIECDDSDDYEWETESFSSTMCNVSECSSCSDDPHCTTKFAINLQAVGQSGPPTTESPNHSLMYTQSLIRTESEREWWRELYYYHCRQEGRATDPFDHPAPEAMDATVPGYGAAADGKINQLLYQPPPSGATPHERFGHPVSWYERLQFDMSGVDLGRMRDATLRAASAELCARGFQRANAGDASARVNRGCAARSRARAGGSNESSEVGEPREKKKKTAQRQKTTVAG